MVRALERFTGPFNRSSSWSSHEPGSWIGWRFMPADQPIECEGCKVLEFRNHDDDQGDAKVVSRRKKPDRQLVACLLTPFGGELNPNANTIPPEQADHDNGTQTRVSASWPFESSLEPAPLWEIDRLWGGWRVSSLLNWQQGGEFLLLLDPQRT